MMTWSIRNILRNLEDPERSLLGPNVVWLEMWGLLLPKNKLKKNFYMTMQLLMFIFIFTEYIEVCLSIIGSDLNKLLENIKYSMVSTVNVSKVVSFLVWQEDWKSIMKYVCEEDFQRRKSRDRKSQDIIRKYTKYCRTITYFYWFLVYSTIMIIIIQSAVKYVIISTNGKNTYDKYDVQVVSTWLPINQYTPLGYFIKISYQLFALLFSGGWITSFDANAITIIVFFKGELELLRRDAKYLFGNEKNPRTKREAKIKLRECQKQHTDLIKYLRLFDSCLSPVMLLYVIVCSGVLCATAYQITMETSALQKFITAEYLIFAVSQLFMYCWHSNELFFVSRDLSLGPYESIWWNRDISEQIDINILTEQFNKAIVFSAGPFTEITVATFISIVKGAYSYYTLLNQSQEN